MCVFSDVLQLGCSHMEPPFNPISAKPYMTLYNILHLCLVPEELDFSISSRDSAVVLQLSPSIPYEHFDSLPVIWYHEGGTGTVHEDTLEIEEGGVIFLQGLEQGEKYSVIVNSSYLFSFLTTKYGKYMYTNLLFFVSFCTILILSISLARPTLHKQGKGHLCT